MKRNNRLLVGAALVAVLLCGIVFGYQGYPFPNTFSMDLRTHDHEWEMSSGASRVFLHNKRTGKVFRYYEEMSGKGWLVEVPIGVQK